MAFSSKALNEAALDHFIYMPVSSQMISYLAVKASKSYNAILYHFNHNYSHHHHLEHLHPPIPTVLSLISPLLNVLSAPSSGNRTSKYLPS
jgi:hypothetical protein